MDISIDHPPPALDCDGRFEVTLTFKYNKTTGDRINVRVLLHQNDPNDPSLQFNANVQNVQLDHDLISLPPQGTHQIRMTGQLSERCKTGAQNVKWFKTIAGVQVPGTKEDLMIFVPSVPFLADEDRDPVVADPAGTFRYTVTLKCCNPGMSPQLRDVDYQMGAVDVAYYRGTPASPVQLDCNNPVRAIGVTGILESPKEAGQVSVRISGGGRCTVVTTIKPNASPDRAAHRLALEAWDG